MTSRQKLTQAGFTLVELAIVLLIIGLLIAGILKGQQLIENSRMTATIQQSKSYEAAVNTFRDSYNGLPGDIINADTRVPGCQAGNGVNCVVGTGNGIVGTTGQIGAVSSGLTTERDQFWLHMALANLITGIVPNYGGTAAEAWGTTLPAGRIAGGFLVGFSDGQAAIGGAANTTMTGHYITLQGLPTGTAAGAAGGGAVTADKAAQLDLKLDDGQPGTGDVIALGTVGATGCYSAAGAAGSYSAGQGTSRVCSVAIRIIN